MDIIRNRGSELIDMQTDIRAEGRAELMTTLALSRIGMAALSAMGLLALFLYLRQNAVVETYRLEIKRVAQGVSDRLEVEVKQRTAQLTQLTQHLQTAREDERNRLARNLHDELGALLTSAKLDAARIKSRLGGTAPEALERLAHLVETLNASIALGRTHHRRPAPVDTGQPGPGRGDRDPGARVRRALAACRCIVNWRQSSSQPARS